MRLRPTRLVLLLLLRLGCRQDTIVMFGMLEVVFRRYTVARGVRVSGELQIFFINVRRGTADFHLRSVRIECPVWVVLMAVVVLRPAPALS